MSEKPPTGSGGVGGDGGPFGELPRDGGKQGKDGAALDRYVDGLMEGDERAAFEARLRGDAALRAEVELQRRIDGRLRAMYAPPARIEMAGRGGSGAGSAGRAGGSSGPRLVGATGPSRKRWVPLAVAAMLALVVGGGGGYWWFVVGTPAPFRQPAEIYAAVASRGFEPEWVCTTDEEFVEAVRDRFGRAVLLPVATPGVEVIGWAYGTPVLTNRTATLMTRVDGHEVLVLIDKGESDVNLRRVGEASGGSGSSSGVSSGLHLYKRRLNGLVLYEVSPLDSARVIGSFEAAGR
ncbi:MAG: hypothetical protein KDA05_12005 [Phycisphaerales bacterium]|nr:hypothetical protein [Phycisphaerales bacterium]